MAKKKVAKKKVAKKKTAKKTASKSVATKAQSAELKGYAIVGMGCLFPEAGSIEEFGNNIQKGKDCIKPIPATHWSPDDYFDSDKKAPDMTYANRGGFINDYYFNPLAYGITPNAIEATDTSQLLSMVVAQKALENAGYPESREFDRDRVSCVFGVTGALELVVPLGARLGHPIWRKALKEAGVESELANDVVERIKDGYVGWQENSFPGLLGNVVAGRVANRLNLGGTNCVVDAACASSLSALHLATLELEAGRSDMVITGGVDTFNDIFMYMCFSKTPALSPTGDSRPFSDKSDGTILGEGIGAVIIKRHADAVRDGDRIIAVIDAVGTSSDGRGQAIYAPVAAGQKKCLKDAYSLAGVDPKDISLVEAHGTGTKVGDAVEISALAEVYNEFKGDDDTWCAVGSVKSQMGHAKAAAGMAGLIKAAMALNSKIIPPTIKVDRPAEGLKDTPFYVNTKSKPWISEGGKLRRAGLSAFGFGGSNFHVVMSESNTKRTDVAWDSEVQILSFGGATKQEIEQKLSSLEIPTEDKKSKTDYWNFVRLMAKECREDFAKKSFECRLVITIDRNGKPLSELIAAAKVELKNSLPGWSLPAGVHFGSGKVEGKTALLFPGQGAQYCNMLSDLACRFPEFLDCLQGAEEVSPLLNRAVYPFQTFDGDKQKEQIATLARTNNAQPALAAVSAGSLEVLRRFGLGYDVTAGHSFGELTALYAAGAYDSEYLYKLAAERGRLMASDGKDRGTMAAMFTTKEAAEKLNASGLELTAREIAVLAKAGIWLRGLPYQST